MGMAGIEGQQPYFRREAPPSDRTSQGEAGKSLSREYPEKPEIHYDGTPAVTVRLVNGVQQDIPHLYVDSRGGQTRWWVERESIASWQERVRAAKENGNKRYKEILPDRIPSSITHNYPNIPPSVLQNHPEYANREWVTLSYSLSPNKEGEIDEHTFLNTPASSKEETTIFSRSVKVDTRGEIQQLESGDKQSEGEGRDNQTQPPQQTGKQ
jgi:hypothetical protein